jgi:hypothetical protein
MSINLTGADEIEPEYNQETKILADEVEDLISWGVNTQGSIRNYLESEDTWNSIEQSENIEDALEYLENENRVSKSFKKYEGFDIGYMVLE